MKRSLLLAALLLPASGPPAEGDRSPSDLALTPDGRWAVTANTTSGSASLVDLESKKTTAEVQVGDRPMAVSLSRKGDRALVSNWLSDTVTLVNVAPPRLTVAATIPVGDEPRGSVFSPDGKEAFVVLSGDDAVAVIDLAAGRETGRIAVGEEPWHVALSRDGGRLAVGNARSETVSLIDVRKRSVAWTVEVYGHNLRHLAASPDGKWAYLPHIEERGRSTTKSHIDQGWVVGNRLTRVRFDTKAPKESIALDEQGRAVGDLDGVAVGPDGKSLAVAAGGTRELLLLRAPLYFSAFGGPGDHIEPDLPKDARRFRRVELGGRPLGTAFTPDGKRVVVANYLRNSVQIVDFDAGAVESEIRLARTDEPSLARRGEAVFYDAKRSFSQWYSCHTCHVDGHTNGSLFDTMNDGKYGTPKKTLSLRGVAKTGPWTWHGWRKDLRKLVRSSFTTTMQGPEPSEQDLDAVMAFLKTLDFVPARPRGAAESIKRGEALFKAKKCNTCHSSPHYTKGEVFEVGLGDYGDAFEGFNPPSLRGVGRRAPYLHDGRAWTLEQVLKYYHRPKKLTRTPDFTDDELRDVIAFLRSL